MHRIRHQNVLKLEGVIIENNMPLIVLPFITNGDLKSHIKRVEQHFSVSNAYVELFILYDR